MAVHISDLLGQTESALAELRAERARLVGQIDRQIEQLEISVSALQNAVNLGGSTQPAGPSVTPRVGSPTLVNGLSAVLGESENGKLTPAQLILGYVKDHAGSTPLQVISSLSIRVAGSKSKGPRRVLSTAIWDLKKRRKLFQDDDGRLWIAA